MVNANKAIFFATALVALILLAGCITYRDRSECDTLKAAATTIVSKAGEAAQCYHEAAIGKAIQNDEADAVILCDEVGKTNNAMSENERNLCISDIAEILKNQTICDRMDYTGFKWVSQDPLGPVLGNYTDNCKAKADPDPNKYKLPACSGGILFLMLPIAAIGAAAYRRKE